MPIRTGKQFLEALKDDLRIFMDGEEIGDIAHDPRTAGAAQTLAELYDMQHDAALRDQMTFASPSSGNPVGRSFMEPKTVDDLIRRREMIKLWMDRTCGMFGRSPDFLNVMLTGLAAAAPEFGKSDRRFADHIRDYHVHARERDLCMTHTLLNPQVDRSRPVERQDKDLAAKIVKETDAGMVLKGARMVSTLCAYSDDLLVLPSTFLATNADAAPYAFAFSIPVAAPGLRFICRPSVVHQNAASVRASEADAAVHPASGLMTPAEMPLWTVRMMFAKMFVRACEIIQLLGAGGLVAVPSYAELSGPAAADVETYAQAANADAPSRVKLFRLAFDTAVSSFSGRQQLYERYYSGDPVRLAGALYAMYPKDAPIARIHSMLDELEARSKT